MCPIFDPDFSGVSAFTPIYEKGLYEVSIEKHRAQCWDKTDKDSGAVTVVACVNYRPKMVGVYDPKTKKIKPELNGKTIQGEDVEEISLYIHSKGALEYSKRVMMAILGYNKEREKEFDAFYKTLDMGFKAEPLGDGKYEITLGSGWDVLLGKNVLVSLSKGTRTNRDGAEQEQQNFNDYLPVGS